jgi:phosphoglycolate phosphatase
MKRLVLFDIDGTLLTAKGAPRVAFSAAMVEVYGTTGPIDTHRFDGKTDPQIARELLQAAAIADEEIDAGLPALWQHYVDGLRRELLQPAHSTTVLPGIPELLDTLERHGDVVLGLLTGNIAEGAALKLEAARIRTPFRVAAFGSDCERRDGLPPIAVERAKEQLGVSFSRRDIVIIGDTPSDVTCGRALSVRAIGVATGSYTAEDLVAAGADMVFDDLSDTEQVVGAILA